MTRRWGLVGAAAASVAILLSGCVTIPLSGDVHTETIDVDPEVPSVILPPRPVAGQTPVEIVQGFLNAGRGPQNRYEIAREFLAPTTEWAPTSRVLVTSSAINPVAVDADTVAVTVTVVGEVDATGRYTQVPSQVQTLSYDLTTVDGENRIVQADPGTVLTRNGFTTAFGAYPLYFYDQSFEFLVPDLRWFPITREVADRIVDELLAGPAPWLGSGVLFNAFPQGTSGRAEYVAPELNVVLSDEVRAESALTQRRMREQLDASFRSLGNVNEIVVVAAGFDLAPAADDTEPVSVYTVREGAVGGFEGQFGALTSAGIDPLTGIRSRTDGFEPVAAALARDRTSVAVLGTGGVTLVTPAGSLPIDSRAGLATPSLDPHGFTWSVPRSDPSGLIVVSAQGEQHQLPLGLEGRVVALEVARDGARVLVALSTANGSRLVVIGIQRDADLVPVAFGAVYDLDAGDPLIDVAWVDGTHVAVLSAGDEASEVDVLALGGPTQRLGEIEGATAIVGGNLIAGIRVLLEDGTVHRPSAAGGWRDTGIVASFLGTQQ